MNLKKTTILVTTFLLLSYSINSQVFHSVKEVYTDSTIQIGDTLNVAGYYTNPDYNYLIDFYGYWNRDQLLPPNFYILLEGIVPPNNAWNGGYIIVTGIVNFIEDPQPNYPEDSLIAILNVFNIDILFGGEGFSPPQQPDSSKINLNEAGTPCDSCKFAVLISGGWDAGNNHSKYWENLVALYNFKVDSMGYCKDNVFVHYYQGVRRDNRIPQDRVKKADSTNISNSFTEISKRVGKCKDQNKPATFQKMVTNHGDTLGEIDLLDPKTLKPGDLKDMQQKIIDSCCSVIYDEFLQCYGGYTVDTMKKLDAKNKTKIYINSNANHISGWSPHNKVHPYLKAKIDSLDKGKPYEDAVVGAKLAYDNYLRTLIDTAHKKAQWFRTHPAAANAEKNLKAWKKDSTDLSNSICTSRNVTITPMKKYCQGERFVIPPGGQLVLGFKGDKKHCGNVTVYWEDPVTGKKKYKVFNWNIPGSAGYKGNNKQRVVNGHPTKTTTFWVHNDDGQFDLTASATGNQTLPEDSSKTYDYPGTSFGWDDNSNQEFVIPSPINIWMEQIDQVPFELKWLPAWLGPTQTSVLGGTFTINPNDIYASNMELYIDIMKVTQPGDLIVNSSGTVGTSIVNIPGPGEYHIPLGDLRPGGSGAFFEIDASNVTFAVDCWGIHSVFESNIPDVELCQGECTLLTAPAGVEYIWSNGETSESINVCPTYTTTYTVTVTDFTGGTLADQGIVTVYPNPIPVATSNSPVNFGDDLLLNGQATQAGFFPGGYCIPAMNNAYEWITDVVFSGIPNPSGPDPNGYGDYTGNVLTNVNPGDILPIEVMIHPDMPPEWVAVFIDYNRNGDFEPNETTFLGDAASGMVTGIVNIPPDATPGETVLRVINKWGDMPEFNPCTPGVYGETEDYKININGSIPAPIETWLWTGPNFFTSMEQNPIRPNITIPDTGLYNLTVTTESGCSASDEVFVEVIADKAMVSAKTILQGNYAGNGLMNMDLNEIIPNDQPFNREPWNYNGMEALSSVIVVTIAPINMVDWILVEIRDAADPTLIIGQRAAILLNNGSVVDTNLSASIAFPGIAPGNYYICLHHRNSLPVMSANPIPLPNSVQFDFSDPATNPPYGGMAQALIELEPGVYGMIGGDVNSDGTLKYSGPGNDRALVLQLIVNITGSSSITTTTDGYFDEDNNMNGTVKYSGPQNDPSIIIQNIVTLTGSPSITSVFTTPVPPGAQGWICGNDFTDARDGNAYSTIQIGTQCWMAQKLAYLPEVYPAADGSYTTPYYYVYNYNGTNVSTAKTFVQYQTYGVLYNWAAAMQGEASSNSIPSGVKGICPDGWHLPSDEEWKMLEGEVDNQFNYPDPEWDDTYWRGSDAGGNLKEVGTIHWSTPNTGATNNSNFTALPGGSRGTAGSFNNIELTGYFWTSSERSTNVTWYRSFSYNNMGSYRTSISKKSGVSVRCVKD